MKVVVIVLNYKRYDLCAQTLIHNLPRAGHPFDLIVVEEFGLARAMNIGIKRASDYDAFMFLANDIYEPDNWLAKRVELMRLANVGIVSIPIEEKKEPSNEMLIGNYLIAKEVIEKIGYFDESFDPYGAIDLDFCSRAQKAGFGTWYLSGCRIEHAGNHGAEDTQRIYGFDKREMINGSWHEFQRRLTDPAYTIYQPQFEGE